MLDEVLVYKVYVLFLSAAFFRNNFRSDKRLDFMHVFKPEICAAMHADLYNSKL